ncbi:MAG: hypothetical protein EOP56_08895 [Sphingobacteriales bacterium]|nr:MAG: hypothetical protein EOP56_08895 [Sphingobacteriales bacterium]
MATIDPTVLALMLIEKDFSNSYALCKVLSRPFGFINCSEVTNRLLTEGKVIISDHNNGNTIFKVSDLGNNAILAGSETLIAELKKEYPDYLDFIEHLQQ